MKNQFINRIIVFSFIIFLLSCNLFSQIIFEQNVLNLKKITNLEERTFEVSLVNQGKKDAEIEKIIIPDKYFDVQAYNPLLKPGEKNTISFSFSPDSTLTDYTFIIGLVIDSKQYDISVKGKVEIIPANEAPEKPLKKIDKNHYRLGNIDILTDTKEISFPARINMQKGPVEVVICTPFGKTHESIFVADVIPSFVQVALLLLDFNYSGDPENLLGSGEKLQIFAEWKNEDGKSESHRIEEFLLNAAENKPMVDTYWVFTGSEFWENIFLADRDGSVVASYFERGALINNPLESGSNDEFYVVNSKIMPAKETIINIKMKKKGE